MTEFVDTDVLIRVITGDDPVKQAAGIALFRRVEAGDLILQAPDTVIADAAFVLTSKRLYGISKNETYEHLAAFVRIPNFVVDNRRLVLRALEIFAESNIDFGDAMIAAAFQGLLLGGFPILQALVWPEFFGRRYLGSILGLTQLVTAVANAGGPVFAGLLFDYAGTYVANIWLLVGTWLTCAVVMLTVRPSRERISVPPVVVGG